MKLNIDKEGRILIPFRIRKEFNLEPETEVELIQTETDIVLRPVQHNCYFCNLPNNDLEQIKLNGKVLNVCNECFKSLYHKTKILTNLKED